MRTRRGDASPAAAEEREPAALGAAGERRGLVGADDRAAVGGIRHAQADPQRAVGEQAVADHAGRALRAEDEMHAEGAAARRDVREDGVQLGMIAEQRRELVDDDHEPRQVDPRIEDVARAGAGDRRPRATGPRRAGSRSRGARPRRRDR